MFYMWCVLYAMCFTMQKRELENTSQQLMKENRTGGLWKKKARQELANTKDNLDKKNEQYKTLDSQCSQSSPLLPTYFVYIQHKTARKIKTI